MPASFRAISGFGASITNLTDFPSIVTARIKSLLTRSPPLGNSKRAKAVKILDRSTDIFILQNYF